MTYQALIHRLGAWCTAHPMVVRFTDGELELADLDKDSPTPHVHAALLGVSYGENSRTYEVEVYVMELYREQDNEALAVREALNNTLLIFEDLMAEVRNGFQSFGRLEVFPLLPVRPTPFIEEHNRVLVGVQATMQLQTPWAADACDSPINETGIPSIACPNATVTINGTTIGTVASGGTLAALVQYENGVPVGSLVSDVWTVPNPVACDPASITTNGDSPALSVASGASQDIAIHDTAGADVGSRSGTTVTVGDTTVTVNSSAYGTTEAESMLNVEVVDDGDNPVGSLSGGKWVVPAGSGPVGAKLMKTGQTTSYATGDDGDIEYGRAIDFFTLASNNPFGHAFRFTGTTGGYYDAGSWRDSSGSAVAEASAIPDNIVVDWSTYDGSTVLGWYRVPRPLHNWATALTDAASFSVGAFTSGWTLPNTNQYFSIWDWSSGTNYGNRFAYEPFGIYSTECWTSNTPVFRTTDAVTLPASTTVPVFARAKTGSFSNLLCREFTVTGTTLS